MMTSDTVPLESTRFQDYPELEPAASYQSKLRCIADKTGSVVYYQTAGEMTALSYIRVASDGSITASGVVED